MSLILIRFMKILHITAIGFLIPKSGVPAVLKALVEEQNKIEGVSARCASLRSNVIDIHSDYFDQVKIGEMESYLKAFEPDIAVFHTIFYLEFVKTARIMDKLKIPYLVEPHGSFGKMAMNKSWLKKRIAIHTFFKPILKNSIGYIYTNVAEFKDSILSKKNTAIVPNGIFKDVVWSSAEKKMSSIQNPVFYFLGRYNIHHKGLDYLFDALDILDKSGEKLTLKLYGFGSEKENAYIKKRISLINNLDVKDCGTIYDSKKKEALENAHILVLTSRYEGSPMTVLDSLSYGNPCVVTPGTNVADELVKNNLGWKANLDAEDIAKTILSAKNDYIVNGSNYSHFCKDYVINNYSWEKIALSSILTYKNMLNKTIEHEK